MAFNFANRASVPITRETERIAAAAAGLLLGAFLIFGAAFASPSAIHDAAHDTRHAFSVPCH